MKINICAQAIILSTCFLNATNYFVAVFFVLKIALDHQIIITLMNENVMILDSKLGKFG